jgi:hypothetical protein
LSPAFTHNSDGELSCYSFLQRPKTLKEKSFKTLLLQALKEGGNHLPSSTGIIIVIISNTQTSTSLPRESHLHSMLINRIAGLNIACLFTLSAYVCVCVCVWVCVKNCRRAWQNQSEEWIRL